MFAVRARAAGGVRGGGGAGGGGQSAGGGGPGERGGRGGGGRRPGGRGRCRRRHATAAAHWSKDQGPAPHSALPLLERGGGAPLQRAPLYRESPVEVSTKVIFS